MKNPKFIVIEGQEGSGKSTLVKTLREVTGDSLVVTREPGGSPYAEAIRDLMFKNPLGQKANAKTMLCLMFAARFDHVENIIIPALDSGKTVVSDRFDASSYAYQLYGQENLVDENLFWSLRGKVTRLPDLYIYAKVDVKEGLRRAKSRNASGVEGNHFDDKELAFHYRLEKGYKAFFERIPHVVIDANQSQQDMVEQFKKILKD